jgi:hypothetical protein
MLKPHWLLSCAVLFLGCDRSGLSVPDGLSVSDAPHVGQHLPDSSRQPDHTAVLDSGVAGCDETSLHFSQSEKDVTAALEALPAAALAYGASQAYFDPPPNGTQQAYMHLQVDLQVLPSEDPPLAALKWLASLNSLPIKPEEYSWNPLHKEPFDGSSQTLAWFIRGKIEDLTFPASAQGTDGLSMEIKKNGTGWRIFSLTIEPSIVFASRDDATAQLRCTPSAAPAETAIRSYNYSGVDFAYCVPTGSYSYTPKPNDPIVWRKELTWLLGGAATYSRWVARRTAELHIAKANWWPEIGKADCFCDDEDHTGFTVVVDALSGAVVRVTAGIWCAVC